MSEMDKSMPTRRNLMRFATGAAAAGFWGLCPLAASSAASGQPEPTTPLRDHLSEIEIKVPGTPDWRHAIPMEIRIGPLKPGQRVESVELSLAGRDFPGLARFTPPLGPVSIDCQLRLEQSETVLVTAWLSDGTSSRIAHRIDFSSPIAPRG